MYDDIKLIGVMLALGDAGFKSSKKAPLRRRVEADRLHEAFRVSIRSNGEWRNGETR